MARKLGKNVAREWREEPQAPELWNALQLARSDPNAGLSVLQAMAEQGSRLSMVFLGEMLSTGRHKAIVDINKGEYWLREAAKRGSIEGKYFLAKHLQRIGSSSEAFDIYMSMAGEKFSPALYNVGYMYYMGDGVERDLLKAISFFRMASRFGHLHAEHWLSHLLIRNDLGLISKFEGVIRRIVFFVPFVAFLLFRPDSDRLRR